MSRLNTPIWIFAVADVHIGNDELVVTQLLGDKGRQVRLMRTTYRTVTVG